MLLVVEQIPERNSGQCHRANRVVSAGSRDPGIQCDFFWSLGSIRYSNRIANPQKKQVVCIYIYMDYGILVSESTYLTNLGFRIHLPSH